MEQSSILASTSFDKIYQIDSPWFPKKPAVSSSSNRIPKINSRQARQSRSLHDDVKSFNNHSGKTINGSRQSIDAPEAVSLQQCASTFLFGATLTSDEQQNLLLLMEKYSTSKSLPESMSNQCRRQLRQEVEKGPNRFGCNSHTEPDSLLPISPPQSSAFSSDYQMTTPELPEWDHANMTPLSPYWSHDSTSKQTDGDLNGVMPPIPNIVEAEPWEHQMRNYIDRSLGFGGDFDIDLGLPEHGL